MTTPRLCKVSNSSTGTPTERPVPTAPLRLGEVLDSLGAGVVVVDARTDIIEEVNEAGAVIIGAPRDQIVGQPCPRFLAPPGAANRPIPAGAELEGNPGHLLLRSDGSSRPVLKWTKRLVLAGDEKRVETFVDITAGKPAEDVDERFRVGSEKGAVGQSLASLDGRLLRVNEALARMWGYTPDERALRESEGRYRTLFESSRDAMMITAPPTWNFVAANKAAMALFGVKENCNIRSRTWRTP